MEISNELKKSIEIVGLSSVLGEDWALELYEEFNKPYMIDLGTYLKDQRKKKTIYPPQDQVFKLFKDTRIADIQVVIVDKELEYCNEDFLQIPESTKVLFKAIEESCYQGLNLAQSLDFKSLWAKQGVFYLNNVLTQDKAEQQTHTNMGWELFTDEVINVLNKQENKIFFLTLGAEAKTKCKNINTDKHVLLNVEHPCIGVYDKTWNYQDCFNQISAFMKQEYKKDLKW